MKTSQKFSLLLGCVWIMILGGAYIVDWAPASGGGGKPVHVAAIVTFVPVLILWWTTGTLKYVVNWFKSNS